MAIYNEAYTLNELSKNDLLNESTSDNINKEKIKSVCNAFLKEFAKNNDNKIKNESSIKGSFANPSYTFEEDSFWIDFDDIDQDAFFNLPLSFWKSLGEKIKAQLKNIVHISRIYIVDDCPVIRFIY